MSFKKIATVENLFCLVIFGMPLYLVRLDIFDIPTNVSELLAVLAIALLFIKERNKLLNILHICHPALDAGSSHAHQTNNVLDSRLRGNDNSMKIVFLSILFMLTGVLLSILFNNSYAVGFGIFKSWFLLPILFSCAMYALLNSKVAIEKIFLSLYLSASLVGFIGLIYKIAGIVTYDGRLAAFYLSPNYLAMYLSSGLFFGIYFLSKSFLQKKFKQSVLHLALLAMIVVPLYYTYSYGAWMAAGGALLAVLALVAPQKKYWLAGSIIALAVILIFLQINTLKFSELTHLSARSSFASRMMIWDASLLMLKQHPLFGIGAGNFQIEYLALQKYFPPYLEWAVPQPHNLFLAFWLQTGIFGLAGFLLLLVWIFRTLSIFIKDEKDAAFAAPLLGFFLYTVLHGLIDTPYWKNDLAFLFWICIFLTVALRNIRNSEK